MKALVTGAGSGLGKALSKKLLSCGYTLLAVGRNLGALKDLPGSPKCVSMDLLDKKELLSLQKTIQEEVPDLYIFNAGCGFYGEFTTLCLQDHLDVLHLNVETILKLTYTSISALLQAKKKGTIVIVSSALSQIPCPGFASYSASKAWLTHFALALHHEYSPYGISILVSLPGQIATDFRLKAAKGTPQHRSSFLTLSVEHVSQEILLQIQKLIPFRIIDFRYRLLLSCAHILPRKWIMKLLHHCVISRLS